MSIVRDSEVEPGLKRLEFGETPIMSTYLLAFIIGELGCVERTADDGTIVRVYGRRAARKSKGRFAARRIGRPAGLLQRVLRHPLPARKDGPHRHSRLRCGRDGELGSDHLPRDCDPRRPGEHLGGHEADRGQHSIPRDGTPVVREPRHDGVVGCPVAERELRLVDGGHGGRPPVPGMGHVDELCFVRHDTRAQPRRSEELPPHPSGGQEPG